MSTKPVFVQGDRLGINPVFIEALRSSDNPHIVVIYGNYRTGKSTKLNHILHGPEALDTPGPFGVGHSQNSETKGCNYFGPVRLSDLADKHTCALPYDGTQSHDADLFFVDTEGLGALDGNSENIVNGIISLLQMASICVYHFADIPTIEMARSVLDGVRVADLLNITDRENDDHRLCITIRSLPMEFKNEDMHFISEKAIEINRDIKERIEKIIDTSGLSNLEVISFPDFYRAGEKQYKNMYNYQLMQLVKKIIDATSTRPVVSGEKLSNIFVSLVEFLKGLRLPSNVEDLPALLEQIARWNMESINKDITKDSEKIFEEIYKKSPKTLIDLSTQKPGMKKWVKERLNATENGDKWCIIQSVLKNEAEVGLDILVVNLQLQADNILKRNIISAKDEIMKKCEELSGTYISKVDKVSEFEKFTDDFIKKNIIKKAEEVINEEVYKYLLEKCNFRDSEDAMLQCIKNKVLDKKTQLQLSQQKTTINNLQGEIDIGKKNLEATKNEINKLQASGKILDQKNKELLKKMEDDKALYEERIDKMTQELNKSSDEFQSIKRALEEQNANAIREAERLRNMIGELEQRLRAQQPPPPPPQPPQKPLVVGCTVKLIAPYARDSYGGGGGNTWAITHAPNQVVRRIIDDGRSHPVDTPVGWCRKDGVIVL